MRRRNFVAGLLLGGTGAARAQVAAKQYRIAIVTAANPVDLISVTGNPNWRAFFAELNRLGLIEGKNLVVDRYSGEGRPEHYPEVAGEIVARTPDAIVAITNIVVSAVAAETKTIPIVSATADPVKLGLVTSLARPGGNITGVSNDAGIEIIGKRLQLLREAVPAAAKIGYLVSPQLWNEPYADALRAAGQTMGVSLVGMLLRESSDDGYQKVFADTAPEKLDGMIAGGQSDNFVHRQAIASLAEQYRLPAMYPFREFVDAGGMMSYASDLNEMFRHLAGQLVEVLKGAKPGEMPIYQAVKFDLVVNLRACKAIGLAMPPILLAGAAEVIE